MPSVSANCLVSKQEFGGVGRHPHAEYKNYQANEASHRVHRVGLND